MCVLNVQPAYAGNFSAASVQRSPRNASCEEQLERAGHSISHAACRTQRRGPTGLEAAMTGADSRGYRLSFCMAPDIRGGDAGAP